MQAEIAAFASNVRLTDCGDRCWSGIRQLAVGYEDICFAADPDQDLRVVSELLSYLGLSTSDEKDRQFAANPRNKVDLGRRDRYAGFSAANELKAKRAEITGFDPRSGQV